MIGTRQLTWVLPFVSACFDPSFKEGPCSPKGECPTGWTCNAQQICVQGSAVIDAPVPDTSLPDDGDAALACYGPSGAWRVCLDAPPAATLDVPSTLDTDTSSLCLATQPTGWTKAQPEACFVAGGRVTVAMTVVHGRRPLVLLAHDQITVTSLLDVASHRAGQGAPLSSADCRPFARSPVNSATPGDGGGAGGSFMTLAGAGGDGDDGQSQGGQPGTADAGASERLRGGCAGQAGGGSAPNSAGGGGGAVYLIAGNQIAVMGAINASGTGGAGASNEAGGSGGGSGGMIVLYAPTITASAATVMIANGGGGGGGGGGSSGSLISGADGKEPLVASPLTAASGGLGGGNAGDGGKGFPAAGTLVAASGGDPTDGGGGGGGGAGYIRSSQPLAGATVSPPADISSP